MADPMQNLTTEDEQFIARANAVEAAMQSAFWPVLRAFCEETRDAALRMSKASVFAAQNCDPIKLAAHVASAHTALDILTRLEELPAQRDALLQDRLAAQQDEGSPEPKTRSRQTRSTSSEL